MAIGKWKDKALATFKQYKYVALMIAIGLLLLLYPSQAKADEPVISNEQANILTVEQQLSAILSSVKGAGNVEVFLSQASGEEILYQIDQNYSTSGDGYDNRTDTVTVSGANREENGLIRQINPPTYLGAIIVCQGADDPAVRLAIVEAVSRVTSLGADKISVLKMQ